MTYHPAPDLDAPPPAEWTPWVTRGFIQVRQAHWIRLDSINDVEFNTGPGKDVCIINLSLELFDDDARAFWVAWTAYLAGDA